MDREQKENERLFRVLLMGRDVVNLYTNENCDYCLDNARWCSRCCWTCLELPECYEIWKLDKLARCPYSQERNKLCSSVGHMYSKFKGDKKGEEIFDKYVRGVR